MGDISRRCTRNLAEVIRGRADEVLLVDSGSTDAIPSTSAVRRRQRCVHIRPEDFSFGRALNGREAATGEILVFVSAHGDPVHERWLEELVAPFDDPEVAPRGSGRRGPETGDHRTKFSEMELMRRRFPARSGSGSISSRNEFERRRPSIARAAAPVRRGPDRGSRTSTGRSARWKSPTAATRPMRRSCTCTRSRWRNCRGIDARRSPTSGSSAISAWGVAGRTGCSPAEVRHDRRRRSSGSIGRPGNSSRWTPRRAVLRHRHAAVRRAKWSPRHVKRRFYYPKGLTRSVPGAHDLHPPAPRASGDACAALQGRLRRRPSSRPRPRQSLRFSRRPRRAAGVRPRVHARGVIRQGRRRPRCHDGAALRARAAGRVDQAWPPRPRPPTAPIGAWRGNGRQGQVGCARPRGGAEARRQSLCGGA